MYKITVIFGTRPEAIKFISIIKALSAVQEVNLQVVVTGQHREMLDQVLQAFQIVPDVDLALMEPGQQLAGLSAKAIQKIDLVLKDFAPQLVLVQGDTSTAFCAALAAFYQKIPVGHVEAGLRTYNLEAPWPEEANRQLISRVATLHFAPTERSKTHLLSEQINPDSVFVTGNTAIDTLFLVKDQLNGHFPAKELETIFKNHKVVLITGHRRENFGAGFQQICEAIAALAKKYPDVHFVYPVHLNPNVQEPVYKALGNGKFANIHLTTPLQYLEFVPLLQQSYLILTDSGGIQEEAPSLGKPVLVMRDTTERQEAIEAGTALLVGTQKDTIVSFTSRLLEDSVFYQQMVAAQNPFGDGQAAQRIVNICLDYLSKTTSTK